MSTDHSNSFLINRKNWNTRFILNFQWKRATDKVRLRFYMFDSVYMYSVLRPVNSDALADLSKNVLPKLMISDLVESFSLVLERTPRCPCPLVLIAFTFQYYMFYICFTFQILVHGPTKRKFLRRTAKISIRLKDFENSLMGSVAEVTVLLGNKRKHS